MTLSLCFGAHKSWLIVLRSPLRFATWHHNECLSSEIALFNGVTVLESVDWTTGLCNGVELPSSVAEFVFFTQVIRKWGQFSSCVQNLILSDIINGNLFARTSFFSCNPHIHMRAFLHIHTWMLSSTTSATLLAAEKLPWCNLGQGHRSACSLERRECFSCAFSTHLFTFPVFKNFTFQSQTSTSTASDPGRFYTTVNLKLLLHLKEIQKYTLRDLPSIIYFFRSNQDAIYKQQTVVDS